GAGNHPGNQGVSRFVIGGALLLFVGDDHAAALHAHQHFVLGIVEVNRFHSCLVLACRQQGRLVDHIGQVGTGKTRRTASDNRQVHVVRERHLFGVNLEDHFATLDIGTRHYDLAVEATGAQQGGVEHVGAVGGGNQDHPFI